MADSAQPYDSNKGAVKEAAADAVSIRTILEKEGADSAVTRLRSEVDSVPDRDRQAYNTALLKNLQGDGRMPNILPDMALAFGMQNSSSILGSSWNWKWNEKVVDGDKLSKVASTESNPVYQELYREMGNKYRSLRSDNAQNGSLTDDYAWKYRLGSPLVPETQLKAQLATDSVKAENRRQLGYLAANPRLFNDIARGGEITMDNVKDFQDKWNQTGTAGADFRKRYASTPDQQRQVGQTLENLRLSFDDGKNKDNKPGSMLQDNVSGFLARHGIEMFSSYGKMTKQSLLDGLGYKSFDEAKLRLPADAGGKPIADVTSLSSYDNTKLLSKNDGPNGVARRMLSGQDQFFKDETGGMSKAIADLTTAIGPASGNYDDRAVNQAKPENRDSVIKSIEATGNSRLRDWFVSRYPADMSAPLTAATSYGPIDNSSSRVVSKQGPDAVAKNMLEGSGLDASARQALSKVLYKEIGVDWKSVRAGTPLINPDGNNNVDMVRDKIAATGNSKLIEWFDQKYPRR